MRALLALALVAVPLSAKSAEVSITPRRVARFDRGVRATTTEQVTPTRDAASTSLRATEAGITPHFAAWLDNNGYATFDFERNDVVGGSFGGKVSDNEQLTHDPVIFIHGNGDTALGWTVGFTGWTASIRDFEDAGYRPAELYATTWGDGDLLQLSLQYHSYEHLTRLRTFVEAVLEYTGADQVDVISHSMGVTMARKVVQGGWAYDGGGWYNLGPALTARVDTFIGIAGANHGLTACHSAAVLTPVCGVDNGFYPGTMWGWWGPFGVSDFLEDLNRESHDEGRQVYTIWSAADEYIGFGCVVWGRFTTRIPGQDGELMFATLPYGHVNTKDLTGDDQVRMVSAHIVN